MTSQQNITHGVLVDIFTTGTLITGKPGCGKSELALSLIARGHQLIADDAPLFVRDNDNNLWGSCPELLQGFLASRNLGMLNIRTMFGDQAIKAKTAMQLIVNLDSRVRGNDEGECGDKEKYREILGIRLPQINIMLTSLCTPEVLIETAVRNFVLQQQGYNANLDFQGKQYDYQRTHHKSRRDR